VTTVTAPDGSTSTSEAHQLLSTSPPYDNRQIIIQNGKPQWEQATVKGRLDLYDAATNTVYLAPASAPHQVPDDPNVNSALAEVHYLLGQPTAVGRVTVKPNAVLDGAAWGSTATRSSACSPGRRPRPACCRCRPSIPAPPSMPAAPITRRPCGGCFTSGCIRGRPPDGPMTSACSQALLA